MPFLKSNLVAAPANVQVHTRGPSKNVTRSTGWTSLHCASQLLRFFTTGRQDPPPAKTMTCFSAILAVLRWYGSKTAVSLRSARINTQSSVDKITSVSLKRANTFKEPQIHTLKMVCLHSDVQPRREPGLGTVI